MRLQKNLRAPVALFFPLIVPFFISASAWSDPYDRQSDTRTATTESVSLGRKHWGFDTDAGVLLRRGNSEISTANFRLGGFRRFGSLNAYLQTQYDYFWIDGFRGVNAGSAVLRVDHELSGSWRVFGFTTHGYNEFLKLDYRATTGGGLWWDHSAENVRYAPSIAVTHEFERFKDLGVERAARLSTRMIVEREITDTAKLGFDFFYVPAFQDWNDFRLFFEPYIETQIYKEWLGLKYRMSFERDNRPKPGVDKNDTSIAVSFTVHLGK